MFEIQTPVNPTSLQSPREFAIGRRGPRAHTFGMSTQPEPMGEVEQKAILAVCVLAAFPDSWMTLIGIAGHAFITTSLLAASFIYYRDMQVWLQTVFEKLKANLPTQQA